MIKDIHLENVATFVCSDGIDICDLSKINFFYGANGSGKTTISRVVNNCSDFNLCSLSWDGSPKETYVYNEDFVQENFFQSDIPGVFTLGKEAKLIEEQIIEKKKELDRLTQDIQKNRGVRDGKTEELRQLENDFCEKCWNLKAKYETDEFGFKEAFKGVRDSKEKFKEKVISEIENSSELKTESFLKEKAKTVFNSNPLKIPQVPLIVFDGLQEIENTNILSEKIIGKTDVNISSLIEKLENSDWVKAGVRYLEATENTCPFCQQSTKEISLKEQLEEYFDDTFSRQINQVQNLKIRYESFINGIIRQLENARATNNKYIDVETLQDKLEIILGHKERNEKAIDEKIEKPSHVMEITSVAGTVEEINALLRDAQEKTVDYNNTVDNIESEKTLLTIHIWKLFSSEIKLDFDAYVAKKETLTKAINGLTNSNDDKVVRIRNTKEELETLESSITSIIPTINAINNMLKGFGFTNFSVAESEKQGFYKVIREDGSDAKKTLSEGEKTFLTFLYFYQRVQGSGTSSGTTEDKVVVFDDPISSLDSDILFIVSSLIRKLINEVKNESGFIKQIFVLTHNVYFHKEVTFKFEGNAITHWMVKKVNKESCVEKREKNPIQTSYQLLWDEVKENNSVTIHNTMRRILETYFKHFGDTDLETLYEQFDGEGQLVCKSLISWIQDGSHSLTDDLYVDNGEEVISKYREVFKGIFEKKDQLAHYNMMMNV